MIIDEVDVLEYSSIFLPIIKETKYAVPFCREHLLNQQFKVTRDMDQSKDSG